MNRIQKKGRGKKVNTISKKQKSIAFNSEQNDEHDDNNDGEDEDLEPAPEKSIQPRVHKQQATNANDVAFRGRGISRCQGRGCSDLPGPSQSCINPLPAAAAHNSVFPGFQNVYNRVQRKGLVKGVDALNNRQKASALSSQHNDEYYDDSDGEDVEMQLIMEKIYQRQLLKHQAAIANNVKNSIGASFGLSNDVRPSSGRSHIEADRRKVVSVEGISNPGRRTKRGRGIGSSDPPGPSQSYIDPSPPPATHNLVSLGMRNDMNKMQKKGLVKVLDALNNKQKFTAVSSEENDEYSDYDDGEDEEMQLMGEKFIEQPLRQQVADTNNVKQYNGGNSGVSNHGSIGSASSDSVPHSTDPPAKDPTSVSLRRSRVEIDRRKVISIEDNPNP
ncbi:hypothetical protein KIW84_023365 [Lathyrus oleraceus]|uniref:Uncharacterized protein n=2 Tax=Pisum sativum TaxID=3888 RepID=A0A9D5B6C8_PEA|nr:hypothetical protein KIW84_023365 [Pisum sativum]